LRLESVGCARNRRSQFKRPARSRRNAVRDGKSKTCAIGPGSAPLEALQEPAKVFGWNDRPVTGDAQQPIVIESHRYRLCRIAMLEGVLDQVPQRPAQGNGTACQLKPTAFGDGGVGAAKFWAGIVDLSAFGTVLVAGLIAAKHGGDALFGR
jgi:hypothetical protein